MSKRTAVLITCFNRCELTLRCLSQLYQQEVLADNDLLLSIFLVDDGGTDGTADTVKKMYGDVHVIQGTGSLYWNGGMRLAWENALSCGDFDYFIWLNDDSMIEPDGVFRLINAAQQLESQGELPALIAGTMMGSEEAKPTYGGRLRSSKLNPLSYGAVVEPTDSPQKVNFVNGNFTLVTKRAVEAIGILNDAYTHGMGDYDYGLRAQYAGLTCWVAPGFFGVCDVNTNVGGCRDQTLPLFDRLKKMKQLSQLPPPKEWMFFVRRHGGKIWLLLWIKAYLRFKFPLVWLWLRSEKNVK